MLGATGLGSASSVICTAGWRRLHAASVERVTACDGRAKGVQEGQVWLGAVYRARHIGRSVGSLLLWRRVCSDRARGRIFRCEKD